MGRKKKPVLHKKDFLNLRPMHRAERRRWIKARGIDYVDGLKRRPFLIKIVKGLGAVPVLKRDQDELEEARQVVRQVTKRLGKVHRKATRPRVGLAVSGVSSKDMSDEMNKYNPRKVAAQKKRSVAEQTNKDMGVRLAVRSAIREERLRKRREVKEPISADGL